MNVCFTVPGQPVPKQRAKITVDDRGHGHGYYPERSPRSKRLSYPAYKDLVRVCCLKALGSGHAGPDTQGWELRVRVWTNNLVGDIEGIMGGVADALEGILWVNDRQIARGVEERWRLADGTFPYVEVEAIPLGGVGFIRASRASWRDGGGGNGGDRASGHFIRVCTAGSDDAKPVAGRPRLTISMDRILEALRHEGNKAAAGRALGCSASYIRKRLKEVDAT